MKSRRKKMKAVLHSIAGGGSEMGLSKYTSKLLCPERHRQDEERKANKKEDFSFFSQLLVGVIGHAYLEHYYKNVYGKGDNPNHYIQFDEVVDERARQVAENTVKHFLEFAPDLGKPVAIEEDIELGAEFVGWPRLTGRLDMLMHFTKRDFTRIRKEWEVDGAVEAIRPGNWIVDWKFRGARQKIAEDQALANWATAAYPVMAAKYKPKGFINVSLVTTKVPQFYLTVVPYPAPERLVALGDFLYKADKAEGYNPIDSACFSYHRTCPYLHGCPGRFGEI